MSYCSLKVYKFSSLRDFLFHIMSSGRPLIWTVVSNSLNRSTQCSGRSVILRSWQNSSKQASPSKSTRDTVTRLSVDSDTKHTTYEKKLEDEPPTSVNSLKKRPNITIVICFYESDFLHIPYTSIFTLLLAKFGFLKLNKLLVYRYLSCIFHKINGHANSMVH